MGAVSGALAWDESAEASAGAVVSLAVCEASASAATVGAAGCDAAEGFAALEDGSGSVAAGVAVASWLESEDARRPSV